MTKPKAKSDAKPIKTEVVVGDHGAMYEFEVNVPIPPKSGGMHNGNTRGLALRLKAMKVGHSFLCDLTQAQIHTSAVGLRPLGFATRITDDGRLRVWRIK